LCLCLVVEIDRDRGILGYVGVCVESLEREVVGVLGRVNPGGFIE